LALIKQSKEQDRIKWLVYTKNISVKT